jgi:hypothetical protein
MEISILIIRKLFGVVLIVLALDILLRGVLSIWHWTGDIQWGNSFAGAILVILGTKVYRG